MELDHRVSQPVAMWQAMWEKDLLLLPLYPLLVRKISRYSLLGLKNSHLIHFQSHCNLHQITDCEICLVFFYRKIIRLITCASQNFPVIKPIMVPPRWRFHNKYVHGKHIDTTKNTVSQHLSMGSKSKLTAECSILDIHPRRLNKSIHGIMWSWE